jgi:hypothetical protein
MKLYEVWGKEQCRVDISNSFAPLESFDDYLGINIAWGIVRGFQNFSQANLGYYKLKKHKPWFDDRCWP